MFKYNKDKIKQELDINQIFDLIDEVGGEPIHHNTYLTCRTICHNGNSHKLYYYDNTKLFKCYTDCEEDSFDIFELVLKVKNISQEKKIRYDKDGQEVLVNWNLYDAVQFVAVFFGFEGEKENFSQKRIKLRDWDFFNKY